jgi:glycerol uptake facilitator-like aquaporin
MNTKLKEFSVLFVLQVFGYLLITVNYRAVATGHYTLTALSDFAYASLTFFVIRKIAKSEDQLHQWFGYVCGSVVGSLLGIYVSKHFLGT